MEFTSPGLGRWVEKDLVWEPFSPTAEMIRETVSATKYGDGVLKEYGLDLEEIMRFVVDSAAPIEEPVLDIGTGRGMVAIEMARRGAKVVAIDTSEESLRAAIANAVAEKVEGLIEFHLADATRIPFEDDRFRLVTMINVLHHIENADGLLEEISRVMAPGGRLLFTDLTEKGFSIIERIEKFQGDGHVRYTSETVDSLADKLQDYGLRCIGRDRRFHQKMVLAKKIL